VSDMKEVFGSKWAYFLQGEIINEPLAEMAPEVLRVADRERHEEMDAAVRIQTGGCFFQGQSLASVASRIALPVERKAGSFPLPAKVFERWIQKHREKSTIVTRILSDGTVTRELRRRELTTS